MWYQYDHLIRLACRVINVLSLFFVHGSSKKMHRVVPMSSLPIWAPNSASVSGGCIQIAFAILLICYVYLLQCTHTNLFRHMAFGGVYAWHALRCTQIRCAGYAIQHTNALRLLHILLNNHVCCNPLLTHGRACSLDCLLSIVVD